MKKRTKKKIWRILGNITTLILTIGACWGFLILTFTLDFALRGVKKQVHPVPLLQVEPKNVSQDNKCYEVKYD